jgi:hypothetical protein
VWNPRILENKKIHHAHFEKSNLALRSCKGRRKTGCSKNKNGVQRKKQNPRMFLLVSKVAMKETGQYS